MVELPLATIDDTLLNYDNQYTISLASLSGADLGDSDSSTVSLIDDDSSVTLVWEGGTNVDTGFSGTIYAAPANDGGLDATGTDYYGHSFTAHVSTDPTTGIQTIDLTIQGLPPGYNHWTGTNDDTTGPATGRYIMKADIAYGGGEWAVNFAAEPKSTPCGAGGDSTTLTRKDFGGAPKPGIGGYHQQWHVFQLAAPAPACGVIVIQKIIMAMTVTTSPGLPGSTPPQPNSPLGTKSFDPPLEYYEVLGRIPLGNGCYRWWTIGWKTVRANRCPIQLPT